MIQAVATKVSSALNLKLAVVSLIAAVAIVIVDGQRKANVSEG